MCGRFLCAFTEDRFDDALFRTANEIRGNRSDIKSAFATLNFTPEELRGFCKIMDGDALLPSSQLGQARRYASKPSRFNEFISRFPNAEQFLRELAFQGAQAKGPPPPLAAVNPAVPAKTTDARTYHEALIQKLNGGSSLGEIVSIKTVVDQESKANPAFWQDANSKRPYAELQAQQWAAFVGKNLRPSSSAVFSAFKKRQIDPVTWKRASKLWQPYAAEMLRLLEGA